MFSFLFDDYSNIGLFVSEGLGHHRQLDLGHSILSVTNTSVSTMTSVSHKLVIVTSWLISSSD